MDIRFIYKNIFEDLYSNRIGLQLYTLYRRYNLSPSKAIDFINTYAPSGIITVENDTTIVLTTKGRTNFKKIIGDIFSDNNFTELTYLSRLVFPPMERHTPYVPHYIIPIDVNKDLFNPKE